MLFTNSRSIQINSDNRVANTPNINMHFLSKYNNNNNNTIIKPIGQTIQPVQQILPKMKWGAPVWFILHAISFQIKPEYFTEMRESIIANIILICNNVPCPICSAHSKTYMSKTNFNAIQTPKDLQTFLFKFHNDVNIRKNVPSYSYEEMELKFASAQIINIFNNFIFHFKNKHHSIRMIADDMHRDRITMTIKNWFQSNIHKFNLL